MPVIDPANNPDVDDDCPNPTNAAAVDAATVTPPVVAAEDSTDSDPGPEDRFPLPKNKGRPKKKASKPVRPASRAPPPPKSHRPLRVQAESASAKKNRVALNAANAASNAREAAAAANAAAPNNVDNAGEAKCSS